MKRITLATLALFGLALPAVAADPLPSWNDTAAKKAIVAFVEKVTKKGSPDFVPGGRAHRHVRQRRHALGRAADVLPVRSSRSTA